MKQLALLHTAATLVPVFQRLCGEKLPQAKVCNLVDDSLIRDVIAAGRLTPSVGRRVCAHIGLAEQTGAELILVTCSSIGAAVEASAPFCSVPVLRVDQPMADEAVRIGGRIGVVATLATTLEPTADLIRRRAALAGRQAEIQTRLCEGAFARLMGGDAAGHDAAVAGALAELSGRCDVIVLAQASMARVADALPPAQKKVPILSSPGIAVEHLASLP